jgi:hypothetical protein
MKTTVIYHSGDYDGIFCREIAKKFLPNAELIGWDFNDSPLEVPDGRIFVLDLPVDKIFGLKFGLDVPVPSDNFAPFLRDVIWIDHHNSSIASHPTSIPGYRIDGVAACRLCWQWFTATNEPHFLHNLPTDVQFKNRQVSEPLAIRLAGEYDVWDHRGDGDLEFQFGLDAQQHIGWDTLLRQLEGGDANFDAERLVVAIIKDGEAAMQCYKKRDADVVRSRSFLVEWEGLKFLALTSPRCNSNTFAALDVPETGHDALMAFFYNGKKWTFSLYHAAHRKDLDLSKIAVKYGGGGHRGACGFTCSDPLPICP